MAATASSPERQQEKPVVPATAVAVGVAGGAAGAAAGGAAGVAAAGSVVALPALWVAGTYAATVAAFEAFTEAVGASVERMGRARLLELDAVPADIEQHVAAEAVFQHAWQTRVRERVRRDLTLAWDHPVAERARRVQAVVARERRWAQARAEAGALRLAHAADRVVLKQESPWGARWELGAAEKHTPDCLAMAGKAYPWEVLDLFHPPVHVGCKCKLRAAAEKDVLELRVAVRRMVAARALLHEATVEG